MRISEVSLPAQRAIIGSWRRRMCRPTAGFDRQLVAASTTTKAPDRAASVMRPRPGQPPDGGPMGSTTIQARFGESINPLGRFVLDRARALGMSRSELVRHLGYRHVGNGHRALSELLTTRQNCTVDRTASRRGSPSGERTRRRCNGGDRPSAARQGVSTHSGPRDSIPDGVQAAPALRNGAGYT